MIRITWLEPAERLVHEFKQLREEGTAPVFLESRWAGSQDLPSDTKRALALDLLDALRALRPEEPDRFDVPPSRDTPTPFPEHELSNKLLGGWTGRMAGCLLGKPVEKVTREGIRAILESIDEWPLKQYFTARGVPDGVAERYPMNRRSRLTSLRENIVCMPEDDDINFAMVNLKVLESYGEDFTTDDVATTWLRMMPVLTVFTAERVAYENLLAYLEPPETARRRNPYREWIGAQIRGDLWGWVSPGDVGRAVSLAWRDARLSHTGNGIYGELYVAAMIAASFAVSDVRTVIEEGLAVIPEQSRLAEAVRFALGLPGRAADWEGAVDALHERYGHYHWVHSINNAALVTAALLYGGGDFEATITNVVMGGWDTDSNGATVGSIVGTMLGRGGIPARWADPLNNSVRTSLKGFDNSTIDELAERTLAQIPTVLRVLL